MAGTAAFHYEGMVCQATLTRQAIAGASCGINEVDPYGGTAPYYAVPPVTSATDGTFILNGVISVATGDYGDPPSYQIDIVITKAGFNYFQQVLGAPNQSYYLTPSGITGKSGLRGYLVSCGIDAAGGLRGFLGSGTYSFRALMGL